MKLEPLYRARFTYPEGWEIPLPGDWVQNFYIAEGRTEGRLAGRFRAANHPQRRADGTYVPDVQGVIETDDGASIFFDYHGYGRAYPVGRRQIVLAATHLCDDKRYTWLNDVVCVGTGEVRTRDDASGTDLVIDLAELVWEPVAE